MRRLLAGLIFLLGAEAFASTSVTINGNSYTLPDHPRVFLDGPGGPLTTAVKDPDGAGPLVAPKAVDSNPAYVALKNAIRPCVSTSPPCDAITLGNASLEAALDWYMDNSQTASLTAAKYYINHIEDFINPVSGGVPEIKHWGSDIYDLNGGMGDRNDFPSLVEPAYAMAYSLIYDQLSGAERTAFAQKIFTDVDEHGYESGCSNQLQPQSGAVASFTSGSTAVTGSGFTGITAGRQIYIRSANLFASAGGWAFVQSVDSDSAMTLTGAPKGWSGGNAATVSAGLLFEVKPYVAGTTCGLTWQMNSNRYVPPGRTLKFAATTLVGSLSASATTMVVASTAGFPATTPYYLLINNQQVVKVTGVAGTTLTVERGALGYTSVTAGNGYSVKYHTNVPNVAADFSHNLVVTKLYGHAAMAVALADDSATARSYLDRVGTDWLYTTVPYNKEMWTAGYNQSGGSGYGPGRQTTLNAALATIFKLIPGSPSLDVSGTNWLKDYVYALYYTVPGSPSLFIPWGQAGIAESYPWRAHQWFMYYPYLFGASTAEVKYWNYWNRTLTNQYTSGNLTSGDNDRYVPFALFYLNETDAQTDYRSVLPLQRVANVVDSPGGGRSLDMWASRTGWSGASDTLVFLQAFAPNYSSDHIGQGAPSSYKVMKGSHYTLTEANSGSDSHTGSGYGGANGTVNVPVFGTAAQYAVTSTGVGIDRSKSDDATSAYSYVRINSRPIYLSSAKVSRSLRYMVHFKKSGTQEYLVHYDDLASTSGITKTVTMLYDNATGASMTTSTLPSLVWTKTSAPARVSTAVLLPSGSNAAKVAPQVVTTHAYQVPVCASLDGTTCDATNTSAEFLFVHRISGSATDSMPTVATIGTIDANFQGVQIEGTDPKVAVFAKGGTSRMSTTFTTTHSGTAQILVAGLTAGTYTLFRGATPVCSNVTVDANEALYCETTSGNISVTAGDPPVDPLIVDATPLTDGTVGTPYSKTFTSTGGTGSGKTWTCTVTCSTVLPPGLSLSSGGALTGTPTLSGAYAFTVQVTDDGANVASRAMSLTINSAAGLVLTGSAAPSSNAAILTYGGMGLAADASCDVAVTADGFVSGSYTSTSTGSARRRDVVNGLAPETAYGVRVDCTGSQTLTFSFVTLATVSGDRLLKFGHAPTPALVAQGVAKIEYYTGTSAAAVAAAIVARSGVVVSCATSCTVSRSAQQGVIYRAWLWTTSGDAIVAQSGITPFVVTGLERPVP